MIKIIRSLTIFEAHTCNARMMGVKSTSRPKGNQNNLFTLLDLWNPASKRNIKKHDGESPMVSDNEQTTLNKYSTYQIYSNIKQRLSFWSCFDLFLASRLRTVLGTSARVSRNSSRTWVENGQKNDENRRARNAHVAKQTHLPHDKIWQGLTRYENDWTNMDKLFCQNEQKS